MHTLAAESLYCTISGPKFDNMVKVFWLHFYRLEDNRAMPSRFSPVSVFNNTLCHKVVALQKFRFRFLLSKPEVIVARKTLEEEILRGTRIKGPPLGYTG